jgi:putative oxidoreductase
MDVLLHWLNGEGAILLARIGLVILFPFSALHKIFFHQEALEQAESSILPGGAVLLILAGALEIVGSALIVLGLFDRLVAFLMAGYCVITALFFHRFWLYPDLLSQGESQGRTHLFDFFKNFGLAGGFLLLVLATQFQTLSDFAHTPLQSAPRTAVSHPSPPTTRGQR